MAKPKTEIETELTVQPIRTGKLTVRIIGTTPMVYNAMSFKSKTWGILYPGGPKNRAEKASTLKHNPRQEFVDSVYAHPADERPTRLHFPGGAFKKAISTAALDIAGVTKSQVGRLTWVEDYNVDIYGVPQMFMAVVKQAGIQRTPDIRTRAILPEWACVLRLSYMMPLLNDQSLVNLLAAAGMFVGIGDGRQEKGSLNFGQFTLVGDDSEDFDRIVKTGGRKQQDAALANPAMFDLETERMMAWFDEEVKRRTGAKAPTVFPGRKGNGNGARLEA